MFKQLTGGANFHRLWRSTLWLGVLFVGTAWGEPHWRQLAPGVEYRPGWVNGNSEQLVHLVRFDPRQGELRHLDGQGRRFRSQEFLDRSQALAVFNGGYFDPKGKPLGLLFANRWVEPRAAGGSAFGGMFSLVGDEPSLLPIYQISEERYQGIRQDPRLRFLIQCGPRLLADSQAVAGLETGTYTRRTAIGFDREGRVLLLATAPFYLMSFAQLQTYLKDQLKLPFALNLDGGSSTQCSVRGQVDCPGYSPVPFALGLFRR